MNVSTDYIVKKIIAVWRNSLGDPEESEHLEDASMLDVEDDEGVFDSIFVFIKKFEDEGDEELTLLDLKESFEFYYIKKIKKLSSVLIDSLCE